MWVAAVILLQRNAMLKSWILVIFSECAYFWTPLLTTGRQTGESLNGRKKALRGAGRQASRESLAELVLALNTERVGFERNVPRLFKLKKIFFFEGHNEHLFPRSAASRTTSNWLHFQARYWENLLALWLGKQWKGSLEKMWTLGSRAGKI